MVTRLNGFASGMDIDTMVKQLMAAQRIPLDKIQQKKQTLEWQRDNYREINNKVLAFRNTAFDMKLQTPYQTKKVSSSDSTVVSVTATANATEGIYTMKVNNLATSASLTSGAAIGGLGGAATLGALGMTAPGPTTLSIGGEKGTAVIQLNTTDTLNSFISSFNSKASTTGVKVSYDKTIDRLFFVSSTTGVDAKIELSSSDSAFITDVLGLTVGSTGTGETVTSSAPVFTTGSTQKINSALTTDQTFRINYDGLDHNFTINSTTSIGQLMTAINGSDLGKAGVSSYLDSAGNLNFNNPDNTKPLSFSDQTLDSSDILDSLKLPSGAAVGVAFNYDKVVGAGINAVVEYNTVVAEYSSNTFSINGINFTAIKVDATAATITVTQDVDSVYNSIKNLVDKYNELTSFVNTKLTESKYRDFQPLTNAQREDLSDDEIVAWELKAKSGLLKNDNILSSAMNRYRFSLVESVSGLPSGDLSQLSDIGITTGSYLEKGKLNISESKLKEAIALNPEQVMNLFIKNDDDDSTDDGDGLATRLYELSAGMISTLNSKAGTSVSTNASYLMGQELTRIDERILRYNDRLVTVEDRYYRQFTAMETAMNKMNSQSSYLMQQFGGG
ncbi:MAG: flagellar filament capping protein FliD [Paenibacillaceae bacterium]